MVSTRSSRSDGRRPLVSVVTIFLNAEAFLMQAIDSVFAQTYADWELLLVDDGSTDSSTNVARRVAEASPDRVRYLEHDRHQNRGMSASRNLGIRHARGRYIAFLDADDVWLPDKLAHQIAILEAEPEAALVCGPVEWWYSWTETRDDRSRDFTAGLSVDADRLIRPPALLLALLRKETPTTTASLVRREAVLRAGGFEERFRGLYEDQALFAKICVREAAYVTSRCSYRWRKHPASSCADAVDRGHYRSARLEFLTWLERYLADHGVTHPELRRTVRTQIRRARHPVVSRLWARVRRS
jgi:glycosyltransferase involved in cell wall biosynthesis